MTISKEIFKAPTKTGTGDQLADHMPQGEAWQAKNMEGTNLRALVDSVAYPFNFVQVKAEEFICEYNICFTTKLIDEWEKSVGLPDDCLGASDESDLQTRRNATKERYSKKSIVTLAEMQAYVDSIFGVGLVTLFNGTEYFGFERTFEGMFLGSLNSRFIIVAEIAPIGEFFEHDFEGTFTGGLDTDKIECVLRRVVPATDLIIFPVKPPVLETTHVVDEFNNVVVDESGNRLAY